MSPVQCWTRLPPKGNPVERLDRMMPSSIARIAKEGSDRASLETVIAARLLTYGTGEARQSSWTARLENNEESW